MKMQKNFMLFAGTCLCLAVGSARAQNATINIMPMGDSVTARGSSPESSYRYWLYTYLTDAGFSNTMFVGNQNGVSDGAPANSWPQEAYENGGPSDDAWTTVNGMNNAASAAGILNSAQNGGTAPGATILLLDLGANDYDDAAEPLKTNLLEVQQNLETIINTFQQANSSTIILLAVPTPWVIADPPDPVQKRYIADLGSAVRKAAQNQRKAGMDVIVVGLHGGFNPRIGADTVDGTHPNIKGEQLIARRYFNALRPILKKMEKEGL